MTNSSSPLSRVFDHDADDPHSLARTGVRNLAHQTLRAEHGPGAVTERPMSPRFHTPLPTPTDYGQGIEAARRIAGHAEALMCDYARRARGDGLPWTALAAPLGVDHDADASESWVTPAEAAFERIAATPSMRLDRRTTHWTCATCEQTVTDYGPYDADPTANESGHAEDCGRHRREIDAYVRNQEADW